MGADKKNRPLRAKRNILLAVAALVVLVSGAVAANYLVVREQDVRQQAAGAWGSCPCNRNGVIVQPSQTRCIFDANDSEGTWQKYRCEFLQGGSFAADACRLDPEGSCSNVSNQTTCGNTDQNDFCYGKNEGDSCADASRCQKNNFGSENCICHLDTATEQNCKAYCGGKSCGEKECGPFTNFNVRECTILGWKQVDGETCTSTPSGNPQPTTTPNTCNGECFVPGSTYDTTVIQNCGSVGRVNGSGTCSSANQLCCTFPETSQTPDVCRFPQLHWNGVRITDTSRIRMNVGESGTLLFSTFADTVYNRDWEQGGKGIQTVAIAGYNSQILTVAPNRWRPYQWGYDRRSFTTTITASASGTTSILAYAEGSKYPGGALERCSITKTFEVLTSSPEPTVSPTAQPTNSPTPLPSSTPSTQPTTSPTASPFGGMCLSITMTKTNGSTNAQSLNVGDSVEFTCAQVAGAARYEFRVRTPNGTFVSLLPINTSARISQPFTLTKTGNHSGQCRICTGESDSTCLSWESL